MEKKEIFQKIDHTNLSQISTWEEIKRTCDEAIKYEVASVCIPPCYVESVKQYVGNKIS